MEGDAPKQAVAFVVDGMGGHLAFTTRQGGGKTVLLHTGLGGASYMQSLSGQIEGGCGHEGGDGALGVRLPRAGAGSRARPRRRPGCRT